MTPEESQAIHGQFRDWCLQVDALCRIHLRCSWTDLCGDMEPLRRAWGSMTPLEFVEHWWQKYDLVWFDKEG